MRPALLRALVLDVYARTIERGELADRALNRALRAHPELHSTERRHVSEAVYAMLRLQRRNDHLLAAGLSRAKLPPITDLPIVDQHKLRYAAALCVDLGDTSQQALAAADVPARFAPVIATVKGADVTWPTDPLERLAVERSLPDWFARRLVAEYGEQADALASALNQRGPLTLRANALKATREQLAEALRAESIESDPGHLSPWALTLRGRHNVFGLEAYKKGLFDVQDEGSQLIAEATGAKAGERVVDACAGAGGKTLALSAMMQNKGLVIACDVNESRLTDLKPRARLAGAFNLEQRVVAPDATGDKAMKAMLDRADVVLVDAPCSGTGSWRRNPDARWRTTESEADAFAPLQSAILERYSRCVKPGGRLVYATCSVLRTENEAVADAFAAAHPEFEPLPFTLPALVLDAKGRLKTLPHLHGTDGFFAAAWRRKK